MRRMALPLLGLLTALSALSSPVHAGDPFPASRPTQTNTTLTINTLHISPTTLGFHPVQFRDIQPSSRLDPVMVGGQPFVQIWIGKTGVMPIDQTIARVVFRSPSTPVLKAVDVIVPPIIVNGGTWGVVVTQLVPVPSGYQPSLGCTVTLDVFNEVLEGNEMNNTVIVPPAP